MLRSTTTALRRTLLASAIIVMLLAALLSSGCEGVGGPLPLTEEELTELDKGQFPGNQDEGLVGGEAPAEGGAGEHAPEGGAEGAAEGSGPVPGEDPAGVDNVETLEAAKQAEELNAAEGSGEGADGEHGAEEPELTHTQLRIQDLLIKSRRIPGAAAEKKNPVEATQRNIEAGRIAYESYCSSCHGKSGFGDGLTTAGMVVLPANLHEDYVQLKPDGALQWVILNGLGTAMPANKGNIDEETAWQLVVYLRTFSAVGSHAIVK